jgi:H/ACA ribonucleoprotein complex subunit 1
MLCSLVTPTRIPYFNAPIYLENKTQIGKVDEILGPINEVFFTVKMEQGMVASSFKKEDKVYIGGDKLLPIERFLPKPKGTTESTFTSRPCIWCPVLMNVEKVGGRGGGRGGARGGGRGGPPMRGGRGGARGGGRGGFGDRGGGRGGRGGY